MAATGSEAASEAAISMLRQGGNAFDAAAAAAFALAVAQPFNSGLGGGGFMVAWRADKREVVVLDFREVAPAKARADMFAAPAAVDPLAPVPSRDGGLAVAVPGAAAGYVELQKRYGKLPLAKVIAPARKLAERGFEVTPLYRRVAQTRLECLRRFPQTARIFLARAARGGEPEVPELGARIVQGDLARTLGAIAARGSAAFYQGRVAGAVVASTAAAGGIVSLDDLKSYRVRERQPLWGSYRGRAIATMPPPSGGGLTVLQILNVLEQERAPEVFRAPAMLHLYAEATRQSYAERAALLGDPGFCPMPVERLGSKAWAVELHAKVAGKPARHSKDLEVGATSEGENTTHLSVVDAQGNAVALTTTLNYLFGSCVVAEGTGVLLNDEMDDFAARPGEANAYGLVTGAANAVAPGKIPLSSMAPTLVFVRGEREKVELVVGSPGGPTIPTTVAQIIVNAFDHGMPLDRAIATGRVHHQFLPDALMMEPNALDAATVRALESFGHRVEVRPQWGDAHAIWIDPATGVRYGASDLRGEGRAVGE